MGRVVPRAKSGLNVAIGQVFFTDFYFCSDGQLSVFYTTRHDRPDKKLSVHSPNREQLLHYFSVASQAGREPRGNNVSSNPNSFDINLLPEKNGTIILITK